jgi:hypothetical protein
MLGKFMARAFGSNQPRYLSLDIDNEQGRLLFQESQKLGGALSAQTLRIRNSGLPRCPPWA